MKDDGGQEYMSLRDWFAGNAPPPPDTFYGSSVPPLQEVDINLVGARLAYEKSTDAWHARRAAEWAILFADAMLEARKK